MESEVESAEFLVDPFIENPVEVETDEFVSVGVGDGHAMSVFH